MEQKNRLSLISTLVVALVCLIPSHEVTAAGYSYYVDYFKVEGNLSTPQQDDFNDGNVSPWYVDSGTVEESGGSANLKNPGDIESFGTATQEQSSLQTTYDSVFKISVGAGNATATSRWITNVQPSPGQAYMMGASFAFDTGNPADIGEIYTYTGIVNADQITADAVSSIIGMPVQTGLFAFFEVGRYVSDILETRVFQVAPIADTAVFDDGSLFLKLHYDELADEIGASIVFGNDENAAAWEPFTNAAIPSHPGDLVFDNWDLEVNSISAVPVPAALPLFGSALGLFGFLGWKRRVPQNIS